MKPRSLNQAPQNTVLAAVAAVGMGCGTSLADMECREVGSQIDTVFSVTDDAGTDTSFKMQVNAVECDRFDDDGRKSAAEPRLINDDIAAIFSDVGADDFEASLGADATSFSNQAQFVEACTEVTEFTDDEFADEWVCVGWVGLGETAGEPVSYALYDRDTQAWIPDEDGFVGRYW